MATTGYEVRVLGLREFLQAVAKADWKTKHLAREPLRKAAEPVRDEAKRLFSKYSTYSASKYGITVRSTGVIEVAQRLRKVTGEHPEWGALQMRDALIPALEDKSEEVVSRLEVAVDEIVSGFERGGMT